MENLAKFAEEKEQIFRTEIKNNFKEQIFVNELKRHYNLRNPKSEKPTMVFFVVRINKEQVKISVGMKVYPKFWIASKAMIDGSIPYIENKNNQLLNDRLNLYDKRFLEYKSLVCNGILTVDKEILRNYITTGKIIMAKKAITHDNIDIKTTLLSYLKEDKSKKESSKDNDRRFINDFGNYLSQYTLKDYTDITFDMMKGFQNWCVENTKGRNGKNATGKTINHKVDCVYGIMQRYLVNRGLMSSSHLSDIKIEPLKEYNIDDEIALRDDELTNLYNYQCESKRDEEIRDLFLLECLTGQRFSDIEKVADLVEQKNGRTYINLVQNKGGSKVQVDIIFQMAIDILEKYSFQLPTYNKKIFNNKDIAKLVGIKGKELLRYDEAGIAGIKTIEKERYECVSSHTGRRTLITLLSLRGFNETEIARYSGHETLSMVRLYDKSKKGTKEKEMFERLKKEHPELILKMVGEEDITKSNDDNKELIQKIEEQAIEKFQLSQEKSQLQDKIKRQQSVIAVERQIADSIIQTHDDLIGQLETGVSYDLIKECNDEADSISQILDNEPFE